MKRREIQAMIAHYGADALTEALEPFVSERRLARIEAVLDARLTSVEVAVERPYDPHNAAAVVRSAEALGAWGVHVIAASERIVRNRSTTAGTGEWLEVSSYGDLDAFLGSARARGMTLAGACVDATHMLDELPLDRPICLLFGNEHAGLSPAAQAACELRYRIPIHGFAESYNLSVSAALSLYSLTARKRAALGRAGDLDASDPRRAGERLRWIVQSVDPRHVRARFPLPAPPRPTPDLGAGDDTTGVE
ncbi:RNA methyltransferase [Pseudenhygromyxa sp. WMMC2535]|uniref:TrmH family RNA methyltransferase n=1 Tax=Pseudenhygromyxa sp. WMMC2535 TaxID=2712867 RepID=UPI0015547E5D|nr:RNA methyltransferase [Pseudenhygromyxa sp. WMMC2535]NVB42126.1 RNA methyltransferase [Pseudenhygromyxa sp. WMMC2535]